MAVDLQSFIDSLPKNKSKLDQWQTEIFTLLSVNATYAQIAQYLNLNGVKVADAEVYLFVNRKKRKNLLEKALRIRENDNSIGTALSSSLPQQHAAKRINEPRNETLKTQIEPVAGPDTDKKIENVVTKTNDIPVTPARQLGDLPKFDFKEAMAKAKLQKPR